MRNFGAIALLTLTLGANSAVAQPAEEGDGVAFSLDNLLNEKKVAPDNAYISSAKNNCGVRKDELDNRFDVCKFGQCYHPVPPAADAEGYTLVPSLIAEGGKKNVEVGHKTVKNWIKIGPIKTDLPNTYLSYACGNR